MDICITSMLYEYCLYLENLQIPNFTRLAKFAMRTSMSIRKPSKGLTSQVASASKKPWKRGSKKIKATMVEETKKATQSKKRERSGIPPPFPYQQKNCITSWTCGSKIQWWSYLPISISQQKKKSEVSFSASITGEVIIIPWIFMLQEHFP